MKIVAIQSSPNLNGLTSKMAQAALRGAAANGAEVELMHLNQLNMIACMACGQGWGHHHLPNELRADQCVHTDDFAALYDKLAEADGIVFSTPVYFHDMSETAKTFLDRLRRCEWPLKQEAKLRGKHLVSIAAAGGSGNGALEAAVQLEKVLIQFMGLKRVASLAVTRFNAEFQMQAAERAGQIMVEMVRKG